MSLQLLFVIDRVLRFYEVLIIVWALMSWFPMRGILYDIHRVLSSVVEPYVGVFRRFIPPLGGFDFSPMIAIVVVEVVRYGLLSLG